MKDDLLIFEALQKFASAVTEKMMQIILGEPEDQLRAPFEGLMSSTGSILGWNVVPTGEVHLPNRLGKPDYGIHRNNLLAGYAELKAPGASADAKQFKGHDREQFKRFSSIPNILYTDGNEWSLYRNGERVDTIIRLSGDVSSDGKDAVTLQDAQALISLLRDFLLWEPIIPTDKKGKIDLKGFARFLAPLCRMLRDDVSDVLKDTGSPIVKLADEWRQLLFPDASDKQFADAYAQTVTFALLLARTEGIDPLDQSQSTTAFKEQYGLLSRAMQLLTDQKARKEISTSFNLLLRIIDVVSPQALTDTQGFWLYFYEDFLAAYDPELRKDAGVYYTPLEVVRAQVRLLDKLLATQLKKPLGFADAGVITLDPAVGTGTYLLGIIDHALARVKEEQGKGAVPGKATELANNLYGFEWMVGPYAVSELRISQTLREYGSSLPDDGLHIYLTDTLESPNAEPPQVTLYQEPVAEQHAKALSVKSEVPVIVCVGNPPYDRHEAARGDNKARTGGWVRWGDEGDNIKNISPILRDFIAPAKAAGYGGHIKNLYNYYVYFWRWALWKVFEHDTSGGPGIVSFISASSYLDGDAFSGMREHMRKICDEIWIIDLGGEGRGTRQSENVFAIQTPVAIAIAIRLKGVDPDEPATVHYTCIEGTRKEKLAKLDTIHDFDAVKWQDCPTDWQDPFRPMVENSKYFSWPLLTDLMPWQHSGVQLKRTWPIAEGLELLGRRWEGLMQAADRAAAFRETGDRTIHGNYRNNLSGQSDSTAIALLPTKSPIPSVTRYAYRSFDRQYLIADSRLISRPRPDLWNVYSEHQVYLSSLFSQPLGAGPALTCSALIPDLHHFSGRGAKDTIPLYRSQDTSEPNILPGLLEILEKAYEREVEPQDFLAYLYGILAHPSFTASFAEELETHQLRIPITKNAVLFEQARSIGARLLWLHTYCERFIPPEFVVGQVPPGRTKCVKAVSSSPEDYPTGFLYDKTKQTLFVGDGEFKPITEDVYEFEVSGLKVVQSWLKYRMKKGAGKKSSPLDDIRPESWTSQFTTELLELLWILTATVERYPEQDKLLKAVVESDCIQGSEIPSVPAQMRKAPKLLSGSDKLDLE
ncbi:MAG: N-6 DNA methylase [Gammaproteobacteria bacterium]|nr:N-6 DNA methylase [Gammaproteobacteria bacterium]